MAMVKPEQLDEDAAEDTMDFRGDELWWIPKREEEARCARNAVAKHAHQVLRVVTSFSVAVGGVVHSVASAAVAFHDRRYHSEDSLLRLANAFGDGRTNAVPYLTVHNLGSSSGAPTATNTDTHPSSSTSSSANAAADSSSIMGKPTGFVFSKGLGFAGQVFGLYSSTRSCLVGIEEKKYLKNLPFMCSFVRRLVSKMLQFENTKGPVFHFYINQDDAKAYLKRLKVPDMEIGSVPLHMAYKFFKERPSLFNFIPAKKQVELAKQLIKKAQGRKAAGQFQGVPVFTSQNLSILVVSPHGVRWFRPYFFKKEELDGVIRSSMEHHYQSLIRNRRAQRHSQLSDFPQDMAEDDLDMLESQEMQDFMEDVDEWGGILESIMAKAAQIYFQDALDTAIFGNKWSRKLVGIQPSFPILVDSFEQRAVIPSTSEAENMNYTGNERNLSSTDDTNGSSFKTKRDWSFGFNFRRDADQKRSENGKARDETTPIDAPHLTVVAGIAGSSTDQVMQAASSAIQEAKEKIEKNEMPLENLFIADLGGPHVWSTSSSNIPGLGDEGKATPA